MVQKTDLTRLGVRIYEGDQVLFIRTEREGLNGYRRSSLSFGSVLKVTAKRLLVKENGSSKEYYVDQGNAFPRR